jgi:DNA mismatch endonuclease (patch repair protein)
MVDTVTKEARSRIIRGIRSKHTLPERILRKALRGYYFRYQPKGIIGNPDIGSKKHKIAIFIDGDFWHGYNWKKLRKTPPRGFWQNKIEANMTRDKKYTKHLRSKGWQVIRIWEHQLLSDKRLCINKIGKIIKKK